jgi:rhodanese-related sulfurtransferase
MRDKLFRMPSRIFVTSSVVVAVLLTVLAIYVTPLKHLNLVSPDPKDIDPVAFWKDYQANPDKYLVLDVRQKNVYDMAHAKGAVSQPIGTLFDLRNLLPRSGKTIVLICTSGRLAGVAYGFLQDQGYLNLLRIEGGLQQWSLDKLPMEGNNLLAPLPTRD